MLSHTPKAIPPRPLTDAQIRNAKPRSKPYKLGDSGRMHLNVTSSGSKLWRLAYRLDGKEMLLALGVYPDVALKDARAGRGQGPLVLWRRSGGEEESGQADHGNHQCPSLQSPRRGIPVQAEAGRARDRDADKERMALSAGHAEAGGAAHRRYHGCGTSSGSASRRKARQSGDRPPTADKNRRGHPLRHRHGAGAGRPSGCSLGRACGAEGHASGGDKRSRRPVARSFVLLTPSTASPASQ